ncbi:MAG: site-2 protease family protein [Austwickia sp.]|nr:site-2 protease family protein [Austwickia sp.]MBK8437015.1 site-2 protease family protein [Austwickia sp.]
MTYLLYTLGVLAIAFGIGVSIALHELGHLIPAKRFGVKVTQYMIGFGPTVASWRRGETEYGIKAIPLGGYVRMIGMLPPQTPAPDGQPERLRSGTTGRFAMLAEQARRDALDEVTPGEEHRVFYRLSTPKKILVMLGGPLMNLVIAAVLLTGYVTLYGVLDDRQPTGAAIAGVSTCVPATVTSGTAPGTSGGPGGSGSAGAGCQGRPAAPAYAAGLRPGDRIVGIDGRTVSTPSDISAIVRPNAGRTMPVQVLRDGQPVTLTVTPVATQLPKLDAAGKLVLDASGKAVTVQGGFLGTTTRPTFATVRQPLSEAPTYIGQAMAGTAGVMLRIPEKMVGVWNAAFGDSERDLNGPISVVGVGRVAGEKAGGEITGSLMDDIDVLPFLVQLLAGLNMALFVFNLIPLMPLDGGQIAGALWEGLRRTVARVTGRPDPGPVDVARALPLAYAVSVVLIGMSALLIYADLVKPVRF